jgi:hypothetical protein
MHEQYITWSGTGAQTCGGYIQLSASANNTTTTQYIVPQTAPTGSAAGAWDYVQIAGTACARIWKFYEQTTQQFFEPIRAFAEYGEKWLNEKYQYIHDPWHYIYVPGQDIEELLGMQNEQMNDLQKKTFATQHLAPINESIEIEGVKRVRDHLVKLLHDEVYRNFQLTEINKVNKILGLKECVWDEQAVTKKLDELKVAWNPRTAWRAKGWQYIHAQAEKRAEELFNEVFTPEEVLRLNTDKRLVIARGDLIFELLPCGGINQLLPNGEKQGWCLVSKEYGLPLKDILVMKKLILEAAPQIVLEIANKRSAFN